MVSTVIADFAGISIAGSGYTITDGTTDTLISWQRFVVSDEGTVFGLADSQDADSQQQQFLPAPRSPIPRGSTCSPSRSTWSPPASSS